MAYTLNSAGDSQGNEQEFVRNFQERMPEILAYKRQHGGDLEGAYGSVTGVPWPAGRSVKLKDGQPEMTKDRTVKSVLSKYVALPAAAALTAAFAPGALPAMGKTLLGGAKAAVGLGGGAKFGVGTGLKIAGMARQGVDAVRNRDIGSLVGLGTDLASGGENADPGSRLANFSSILGPAGAATRAATQQAAENRAAQQAASVSGVGVDREAMRNMSTASYIAGGGQRDPRNPFAGTIFEGRAPAPERRSTRRESPQERAFAKAMQDELLRRQAAGESLTTSGIKGPGTMERMGEFAGPGLSILDAFLNRPRRPSTADVATPPYTGGSGNPFANVQF